jgi:hypothetical protein
MDDDKPNHWQRGYDARMRGEQYCWLSHPQWRSGWRAADADCAGKRSRPESASLIVSRESA